MKKPKEVYVILHNIRSLYNVGSVFRTADGVGVSKIFLTGYTPSPVDEMGRPRREIEKTALGAERVVSWERVPRASWLISHLKKENIQVVALELTDNAINYRDYKPNGPTALLLGNEVRGLSSALLKKCDAVIYIPMRGKKESLNVSVAFGVAAYQLRAYPETTF